MVSQIIEHMKNTGEWGEFFPSSASPFGYNETLANEYFPLTKEEALEKDFKWSDYKKPLPQAEKIIKAHELPENIENISDDILNTAIECEKSNKLFKITSTELKFYKNHNIPIPHLHYEERHNNRMKLKNPYKFWNRTCDKCQKDIKTTYSSEKASKVYCINCYRKELY